MWQTCCRHQNTIFNSVQNIKNMPNLVIKRKNICQTIKKISVLFAIVILMSALFLLRYYGSCYRLQHVEKAKNKTQKRTRHVKEERTWQSGKKKHAEKAKKWERRQKKRKRRKGAKIARYYLVKGWDQFYTFRINSWKHFLLFKHFCTLSWGAYSTKFPFIFYEIYLLLLFMPYYDQ